MLYTIIWERNGEGYLEGQGVDEDVCKVGDVLQ
jgi:hypothetical protein